MKYKAYIEELKHSGIVPGLSNIRNLLKELGDPQERIPCIHVAGTNGKGSVCAMLGSILTESGRKTGRFQSPSISCYQEIIRIGEKMITDDQLEFYYEKIRNAAVRLREKGLGTPTLFEAETAIAFCFFADQKVDYAIMECGMGGESDATNVIRDPLITIITSVDYDHTEYLGNTLKEIARNKAGIMKKGSKCVLSPEITEELHREAQGFVDLKQIFLEKAQEVDSECIWANPGKMSRIEESPFGATFVYDEIAYKIPLAGSHQIRNALTAILAAKEILPCDVGPDQISGIIQRGLAKTVWPGRLEKIGEHPLIIRDGAHNPAGVKMLTAYLEKHFYDRQIIYVTGILKDKDYEAMIDESISLASRAYVFRPGNARGLDASVLADTIRKRSEVPVTCCSCVREALALAIREADPTDMIILWGSLSFMTEMPTDVTRLRSWAFEGE